MDWLSSTTCLLVGSALPLGIGGALLQRGWRQFAVAEAYGEVSRRLGLPVDTRGVSLHGHIGDRRLWVGEVMVGHGPSRRMMCWGVLDLDVPLGLGLLLRRRGLSERVFRRARSPEVALPNPRLERLLEVHGDDPARVRALLDDAVVEALAALVLRWRDVVVTDQTVRVHLKQPLATPSDLQQLVDGLFDLGERVTAARVRVPPPEPLHALHGAMQTVANRRSMTLIPHLPALEGKVQDRKVVLVPSRSSRGYTLQLRVFRSPALTRGVDGRERPRELGLLVRPQVEPDGYWSVGQDIQLGDEAFDRSFVVKGWDPDAIRVLLRPAIPSLLALAPIGRLEVDDRHLRLRGLALDVAAADAALDIAVDAVRHLDEASDAERSGLR